MQRWIDRYGLPIDVDFPEPLIELRSKLGVLAIGRDRNALVQRLAKQGGDADKLARFMDKQRRVADTLWALFDEPDLLPPITPSSLWRHVTRTRRYAPLVPLLGKPLGTLVDRFGLADHLPLRLYLDAMCQITVQTNAANAEAPFALAAIDYLFRGTGHVRHGIGSLANALCDLVERLGGAVRFSTRAHGIARHGRGFVVETRRGRAYADAVVANLLPRALRAQVGRTIGPSGLSMLARLDERVRTGWGAAMLYLGVDGRRLPSQPYHLELVDDPDAPLTEGNHLFCSVSGEDELARAPEGQRTVTVSTHIAMPDLPEAAHARRIASIQERMRETLALRAPELAERVVMSMPASPRTFERFTGRPGGYVGGIPRVASLRHYRYLGPLEIEAGLYLVGDTAFPGQSTLATAIGGVRTAEAIIGRASRAA